MTPRGGSSSVSSLGIAIEPGRLTARGIAGNAESRAFTWEHGLPALDATSAEWSAAVADAMRALRKVAPHAGVVHVSLLPPLVDVRVASMPRIAPAELRAAIGRDTTRYFPTGDERQIVQARITEPSSNPMAPHLLSSAPEKIIDAVVDGAAASGFRLGALAPAQLAWAAAVERGGGLTTGGHAGGSLKRTIGLVRLGDRTELLELAGDRLTGLRRLRTGGERDWGDGAATMHTIASGMDDAADVAARHAAVSGNASLWPERVYAEQARGQWVAAARYAAAAVGMVAAAAILAWVGAGRSLSRARAERATLAPQVAVAMRARDSLARVERTRTTLTRFTFGRPTWSAVIVEIARALPEDASLISLRAAGDTLFIIGDADHAAPVFSALSASRAFGGVRAEAPIQQQLENGAVVAERFNIALRMRSGGAP